MKFPVTEELQRTVDNTPHITEVHFTADGHHHFRAFEHKGKKYTRMHQIAEITDKGIQTNRLITVPITDSKGKDHEAHTVVETVSRKEILEAKTTNKPEPSAIKKADILALLEISEEELKALMDKKKK